jgi:ABC-type nitrate/sulfonate/bicarbonate transport system substrate-binding protein
VQLVSVAVIGHADDQAIRRARDSPIKTLKDFEGKLVGYKSTASADYSPC